MQKSDSDDSDVSEISEAEDELEEIDTTAILPRRTRGAKVPHAYMHALLDDSALTHAWMHRWTTSLCLVQTRVTTTMMMMSEGSQIRYFTFCPVLCGVVLCWLAQCRKEVRERKCEEGRWKGGSGLVCGNCVWKGREG